MPYYARFEQGMSFDRVMLDIIARFSVGRSFGFKINPTRLFWLGEHLDLAATFGGPETRWIDMRRWNVVRQACSFVRAKRSGVWHKLNDQTVLPAGPAKPDMEMTDRQVWSEIAGILRQERQADAFYASAHIAPLRIFYEEILDSKRQLLLRVTRHIGAPLTLAQAAAIKEKTTKLASKDDEREDDAFVERHAEALNRVAALRGRSDGAMELEEFLSKQMEVRHEPAGARF